MTISYSGNVFEILRRWKGSIWRCIWKELVLYMTVYYCIRIAYRYGLDNCNCLPATQTPQNQSAYTICSTYSRLTYSDRVKNYAVGLEHPCMGHRYCIWLHAKTYRNPYRNTYRETFEHLVKAFDGFTARIPLTFMLGFYVSLIVKRWWSQFELIVWPDNLTITLCGVWRTESAHDVNARRTAARYLNLCTALCWRDVSGRVRARFPTLRHVVKANLLTDDEQKILDNCPTDALRWQLPLMWIEHQLDEELQNEHIQSPLYASILHDLNDYRDCCRKLYCYDWVCVPLVYTQVAVMATYGYFMMCLIGRQFVDPKRQAEGHEVDFYFPVFTVLQFLFFVGWLKVGQDLIRPFGSDDDDIELNYILDRNVACSYALVNKVHGMRTMAVRGLPYTVNGQTINIGDSTSADKLCRMTGDTTVYLPHTHLSAKRADRPPKLHTDVCAARVSVRDMDIAVNPLTDQLTPTKLKKFHQRRWATKNFRMF